MSTPVIVRRFRLSMVWPALVTDLLGRHPPAAPLSQARDAYASFFEQAVDGQAPFNPPWEDTIEESFWRRYTTQQPDLEPPAVRRRDAARYVVPLQRPIDLPQSAPAGWSWSAFILFHPFGAALVVHAMTPPAGEAQESSIPAPDLIDEAYQVRAAAGTTDWNAFATTALNQAAAQHGASVATVQQPLTIATFLDVDAYRSVGQQDLDLWLHSLASWPPQASWRNALPAPSPALDLGSQFGLQDHRIQAGHDGWTVWFPHAFSLRSLSAVHRDTVFLTVQTEMLGRFLERTANEPRPLPPVWQDWAKRAAQTSGLLYAGKLLACDTNLAAVQLTTRNLTGPINAVRTGLGMSPLH